MENIRAEARPSGIVCEVCGRDMLIKLGRNGYFLGCAGYPDCTNTKEFMRDDTGKIRVVEEKRQETEETCEKCGAPMVVKRGRSASSWPAAPTRSARAPRASPGAGATDRVCGQVRGT
jgi:DNA topoisomerase-1